MNIQTKIKMNNGEEIPIIGLGVFKAKEATADAVSFALNTGYRLIDTARFYGNESSVGDGIIQSGIPREEIFVTTKVWNESQRNGTQLDSVYASLKDLQLDYIDLLLIHWPVADKYKETWKIFEELYKDGKVRSIGLSNFEIHHIENILEIAAVLPVINQIEVHPLNTRKELIAYCTANHIACEAWSPLGAGTILNREELIQMGEKYGKTAAQIILRWDIQQGLITIPKSTNHERILENCNIFDFELSKDDMQKLDGMNRNQVNSVTGADPNSFKF